MLGDKIKSRGREFQILGPGSADLGYGSRYSGFLTNLPTNKKVLLRGL